MENSNFYILNAISHDWPQRVVSARKMANKYGEINVFKINLSTLYNTVPNQNIFS